MQNNPAQSVLVLNDVPAPFTSATIFPVLARMPGPSDKLPNNLHIRHSESTSRKEKKFKSYRMIITAPSLLDEAHAKFPGVELKDVHGKKDIARLQEMMDKNIEADFQRKKYVQDTMAGINAFFMQQLRGRLVVNGVALRASVFEQDSKAQAYKTPLQRIQDDFLPLGVTAYNELAAALKDNDLSETDVDFRDSAAHAEWVSDGWQNERIKEVHSTSTHPEMAETSLGLAIRCLGAEKVHVFELESGIGTALRGFASHPQVTQVQCFQPEKYAFQQLQHNAKALSNLSMFYADWLADTSTLYAYVTKWQDALRKVGDTYKFEPFERLADRLDHFVSTTRKLLTALKKQNDAWRTTAQFAAAANCYMSRQWPDMILHNSQYEDFTDYRKRDPTTKRIGYMAWKWSDGKRAGAVERTKHGGMRGPRAGDERKQKPEEVAKGAWKALFREMGAQQNAFWNQLLSSVPSVNDKLALLQKQMQLDLQNPDVLLAVAENSDEVEDELIKALTKDMADLRTQYKQSVLNAKKPSTSIKIVVPAQAGAAVESKEANKKKPPVSDYSLFTQLIKRCENVVAKVDLDCLIVTVPVNFSITTFAKSMRQLGATVLWSTGEKSFHHVYVFSKNMLPDIDRLPAAAASAARAYPELSRIDGWFRTSRVNLYPMPYYFDLHQHFHSTFGVNQVRRAEMGIDRSVALLSADELFLGLRTPAQNISAEDLKLESEARAGPLWTYAVASAMLRSLRSSIYILPSAEMEAIATDEKQVPRFMPQMPIPSSQRYHFIGIHMTTWQLACFKRMFRTVMLQRFSNDPLASEEAAAEWVDSNRIIDHVFQSNTVVADQLNNYRDNVLLKTVVEFDDKRGAVFLSNAVSSSPKKYAQAMTEIRYLFESFIVGDLVKGGLPLTRPVIWLAPSSEEEHGRRSEKAVFDALGNDCTLIRVTAEFDVDKTKQTLFGGAILFRAPVASYAAIIESYCLHLARGLHAVVCYEPNVPVKETYFICMTAPKRAYEAHYETTYPFESIDVVKTPTEFFDDRTRKLRQTAAIDATELFETED